MIPKSKNYPLDDVELLSKSFAKCLVEKGFTSNDLITAATIMLDQAIETRPKPKLAVDPKANLKVLRQRQKN